MSDQVRISELTGVTQFNDSDDIVLVQGGQTVRISLADVTTQTAHQNDDNYLIIRSNQLYQIDSTDLPVSGIVGELRIVPGNVQSVSQTFPLLCLTNFEGIITVNSTNWPDLVPWLRSQQAIYLEGQTGQTSAYTSNIAGSVITLNDNTANNALMAALQEDLLATGNVFTDWRTVNVQGVIFEITAIDVPTRAITVNGTPSSGAQSIIVNPYQIASSTTSARVHDMRGKSFAGTGLTDTISGLMRRDAFQGHRHDVITPDDVSRSEVGAKNASGAIQTTYSLGDTSALIGNGLRISDPRTDTINGDPRTGDTTHGPDIGGHIYLFGGRYVP